MRGLAAKLARTMCAASLVACQTGTSIALPTTELQSCIGTGLAAELRGNIADPSVAWLEDLADGSRIEVIWPVGFTARFAPDLEIRDGSDRVLLKTGDYVNGSCGTVDGRLLLAPPFLAYRLECGPVRPSDCQVKATHVANANGWPVSEIQLVRFLSPHQYLLRLEDGTEVQGQL